MGLTILDMIVLGAVVLSALLAAVRGFTREVLSIASWAAAAVAAWVFHPSLCLREAAYPPGHRRAGDRHRGDLSRHAGDRLDHHARISDFVLDSRIGALDRTLGFAFGAARGLLLAVVGFLLWTQLVPDNRQPAWIREAKTRPLLESTGKSLLAMLPDNIDTSGLMRSIVPRGEPTEAPAEEPRPAGQTPAPASRAAAEVTCP